MNRYIHILLISVSFFWGTSFAAAKIALQELYPLNLVFLRFTLASIIFGAILLHLRKDSKLELRDIPTFLVMGFVGITSYFYIQFTGLQYTTTIHSALIIATSPLLVAVISGVLHIEKINSAMLCGIGLAFVGVSLVVCGGTFAGILQLQTLKGDLMLLSNAIVWAGITLYGKKVLLKYRPIVAMAYMHIFGTLLLLPFALITGLFASQNVVLQLTTMSWPSIIAGLYLAIFCSVYGYYVWYMGIEKIGAVSTAVFGYINPFFTSIAGVLFLHERTSSITIFGGCMIMAGVYITNEFKPVVKSKEISNGL